MGYISFILQIIPLLYLVSTPVVIASEHPVPDGSVERGDSQTPVEGDYVDFPAGFFERFRPVTALDMVNQVPGFQLEEAIEDVRGFGTTVGNVLINDRRPSAKQDILSSILARIPASAVERIELIRRQVRNIDLRGEPTVVNIILYQENPAVIQWETELERRFGYGTVTPGAKLSLSNTWNNIEFILGIDAKRYAAGRTGVDDVLDTTGNLEEKRFDHREIRNSYIKSNLNSMTWMGLTLVHLNLGFNYDWQINNTISRRVQQVPEGPERQDIVDEHVETPTFEAGFDAERNLSGDLTGKLIFLYNHGKDELLATQSNINDTGQQTLFREATGQLESSETIARLELDWTVFTDHLLQANLERAHNILDSTLTQTDDTGSGPVEVDVPGANSRVKEIRWDLLLKDTWLLGNLELDFGLGAEASTITQTGDANQKRDFFFLKPQLILTYSPLTEIQARFQLSREVAQLDLAGFVSATEFDENDLALGNPDIRPDTTWIMELSGERRFADVGVMKLTGFHHWITDVLDLIPLTASFEAPGNIGEGRRWGIEWDSTLPLDWLRLVDARLNLKFRWQDSTVFDPVTGEKRVLSLKGSPGGGINFYVENRYAWLIDYRQDFRPERFAWGWSLIERAERFLFKVNELEVYDEGVQVDAFIETTRWFGVKMELIAENLLNFEEERVRSIYTGERDLTPLASRQLRHRTRGTKLVFAVSGSF